MNDAVLTPPDANTGMTSLLRLDAVPDPAHAPPAEDDVSVAGVMMLSAVSVLMAVLAMVGFALVLIGCWWLISHVLVPAAVHHLLARLHRARH